MLIDNNRLSHWLVVGVVIWLGYLLLFGIPIFHFGMHASIKKVVAFFCAACLLQLSVTPWMFWARATPAEPNRRFEHRLAAAGVWLISTAILLLLFLQYGKAIDTLHFSERLTLIVSVTIGFGALALGIGRKIIVNPRK